MNTRLAPSRSAASAAESAAGRPNTTRSIPVKTISPARMGSEAIGWPGGGEGGPLRSLAMASREVVWLLASKRFQGSIWGMSDETCRLAAADGDPRGAGVRSNQEWPDRECPGRECIDLRRPAGGVLAGLLDLPLDGLRTLGEDHGIRCPAQ